MTTFIPEITFAVVFLLGNLAMIVWRRRQDDPDTFFFCCIWSLTALFIYLAIRELAIGSFFILIPLLFFGIFLLAYFKEKARLANGLLFNLFLIVFGGYLVYNLFSTGSLIVGGLLAVALVALLLVAAFGIMTLVVFLYWNAAVVIKKESHSLANLLTLLLALFLTVFLIYDYFIAQQLPNWLSSFLSCLPLIMMYFFIVFYNFLTVSVLYQFNHPRYDQDYIIVLGAGLLRGEKVSPLLARRIDKAIEFYRLQQKAKNKAAKLVMSGGQGADEKLSEAAAMAAYALEQGIPQEDIILEDHSTTTLENMRFSKKVMDERSPEGYKVIFSSNNYHIFRGGMFAHQAGLKADGIGAKTALYYLPNAFLREYIAILMMNKRRHLLVVGTILVLTTLFALLNLFVM
ncbi:YdcF family protein [Candidatus Enterococcus leclercqii]|uniref:YdcF family protein n=1 Tax=Candidatus Enterococcus leclercqii TaxID=1857218 RepID=UPI00137A3D3E|nr:YdcF family protein [Enterococcus sp. CU9D]KAF1291953.1 hypothetical protein BAU14_05310 [Enterococcus sp. CU9D]